MKKAGLIVYSNGYLHDTRHIVNRPARLSPVALEEGYWRTYKDFYRWDNILRGASTNPARGCSPRRLLGRLEAARAYIDPLARVFADRHTRARRQRLYGSWSMYSASW